MEHPFISSEMQHPSTSSTSSEMQHSSTSGTSSEMKSSTNNVKELKRKVKIKAFQIAWLHNEIYKG